MHNFSGIPINQKLGYQPILHKEEQWFFRPNFPSVPVFTIHTVDFFQVRPLLNQVDTRGEGRIHFWAREKNESKGVLVICLLGAPNTINAINIYSYHGKWVDTGLSKMMAKTTAIDKEMFGYCLSGFLVEYLANRYLFIK